MNEFGPTAFREGPDLEPMDNSQLKSLRDPAQIKLRLAALNEPHIEPLAKFVQDLRQQGYGEVPNFDPEDGGVEAEALFVLEKPGQKAIESGFVSRNNNDETAANVLRFMERAEIPRKKTCLWNAVPGRNGPGKPTSVEIRQGAEALTRLLEILRNVRVVVLVGNEAAQAWLAKNQRALPIVKSAHPSPTNRGYNPDQWNEIPVQWASVKSFLSANPT